MVTQMKNINICSKKHCINILKLFEKEKELRFNTIKNKFKITSKALIILIRILLFNGFISFSYSTKNKNKILSYRAKPKLYRILKIVKQLN